MEADSGFLTGFGFMFGVGYEFVSHWSMELGFSWGSSSGDVAGGNFTTDAKALSLSVIGIAY